MTLNLKKYISLLITALLGVFVLLAIIFCAETADDNPLALFELGIVQGLRNEEGYSMFLGVPYAKINRTNRFGVSTPYGLFKTHYEAYNHKSKELCPCSRHNDKLENTSDCLYLNIYIPKNIETKLPVLAYIYGDKTKELEFNTIKILLEQNIVIVTMYYRTGIYGFMCTNLPELPGNQGFKDQTLGLKWIKDYIKEFGGDSNNITVLEESIEGHGLDFHLLYGEERLFDRIILDNATAFYPSVIQAANDSVPLCLAKELGCESNNAEEALIFLSTIDEISLIKASQSLNITYKPCVEKQFGNKEMFITDSIAKAKNVNKTNVTVLLLQNKDQAIKDYRTDITSNNSLGTFYNVLSKFNIHEEKFKKVESLIRSVYIEDDNNYEQVKQGVNEFVLDIYHYYPIRRGIRKYIENDAKVYYGLYSHKEHLNSLPKVFSENIDLDDNRIVIYYLRTFWTKFIKFGDPTAGASMIPSITWQAVTNDKILYLDIDYEIRILSDNKPQNESRYDTGSGYKISEILEQFH